MAKEFLSRNGIKFTEHNVAEDKQARQEMLNKSKQMGVPVILVNDDVVVGFNKTHLENLLGLSTGSPGGQ